MIIEERPLFSNQFQLLITNYLYYLSVYLTIKIFDCPLAVNYQNNANKGVGQKRATERQTERERVGLLLKPVEIVEENSVFLAKTRANTVIV